MASIPILKGVRTHFRNILDKEITNAMAICGSEISECNRNIHLQEARKCLKVMKLYIGRLDGLQKHFSVVQTLSPTTQLHKNVDFAVKCTGVMNPQSTNTGTEEAKT